MKAYIEKTPTDSLLLHYLKRFEREGGERCKATAKTGDQKEANFLGIRGNCSGKQADQEAADDVGEKSPVRKECSTGVPEEGDAIAKDPSDGRAESNNKKIDNHERCSI